MLLKLILCYTPMLIFKQLVALPAYHQNDYDVKVEISEVVWHNKTIARDLKFIYGFWNRTQRIYNASLYILKNLSRDLTVTLQLYKFANNEYREFPLRVGVNVCDEYYRNSFNIKGLLRNISNIKGCPLLKGFYYFYNGVVDFSRFPPYIPRGRYKAVSNAYHKEDFFHEHHIYLSILDKPLKWRN